MDKLKPILEQKFWILSGLALIMPFVGWLIVTKTYATGVEERETVINNAFQSVQISGEIPNGVWVENAEVIVNAEQKRLDQAQRSLWESQKQSMTWPSGVQQLMDDVAYEGEISSVARERYRLGYYRQLTKMEQALRRIDMLTGTGEGVLLMDRLSYTHIPDGTWASQPPITQEMWDAQIDYWLVKAVLDSIESMNRGADKITESSVRQVLELTLRGGARDYSSGGSADGSADSGDSGMGGAEGYGYGGGGPGLGSGGGGSKINASAQFDLSEELGPSKGAGGTGTGGGEGYGAMPTTGDGEGGGGDGGAPAGPDRYVDDDEGYPFRTRAFVLGVLMKHDDLPKFLSELSGSDWPIQVIRVQMSAVNPDILSDVGLMGGRTTPGVRSGSGAFGGTNSFGSGGGEDYNSEAGGGSFGSGGGGITSSRPGVPRINGAGLANSGLIQQSMTDPHLAEVWVGGLVTLFRPIEEQPVEEAAEGYATEPETADAQVPEDSVDATTAGETTVDENAPPADAKTESAEDTEAAPAAEKSETEESTDQATDAADGSDETDVKPPVPATEGGT